MRRRIELRDSILDYGMMTIAVMSADGPVDTGITLHELINFIHESGNCGSRHLSGGEQIMLAEGIDPRWPDGKPADPVVEKDEKDGESLGPEDGVNPPVTQGPVTEAMQQVVVDHTPGVEVKLQED